MSTIRYTVGGNYNTSFSEEATYDHAIVDGAVSSYQVIDVYINVDFSRNVIVFQADTTSPLSPETNGLMYDFSDLSVPGHITGGTFGDLIRTGSSNDTLNGATGDDILEGGIGNNTINGGPGINTISYENFDIGSTWGVSVNLSGGWAESLFQSGLTDQISNVRNIHGSIFTDTLVGDAANNVITGGGGSDYVFGYDGNDRIILKGVGYVDGGLDYDILVLEDGALPYGFSGSPIANVEQINLLDGVEANFSQLASTFDLFRSASLADGGVSLTTTDFVDKIRAGLGEDTISAGGHDDTVLVFDGGSATIDGGAGTDRLLVQSGSHTFTDATLVDMEFLVVRSGASLDLGAMTASTGKITSTSVTGDGATIIGTAGAEWIRLGSGGDEVMGGAGIDTLAGGAGDDTFRYDAEGFGRDQLFADLAADHVDLAGLATSLDDLSFRTSFDGNDVLVSISGLPDTDVIVLNDVTLDDVRAAADGFFLF